MARRPVDIPPNAMSKDELRKFQHGLALLSPQSVKEKYKTVLDRARFLELASPRMMQELVALWKTLWRWRR